MNRAAAVTGSVLVALGLSIFAWKTLVLQLPILPSNVENLWRVELEIEARGSGARGSVRAGSISSSATALVCCQPPKEKRTGTNAAPMASTPIAQAPAIKLACKRSPAGLCRSMRTKRTVKLSQPTVAKATPAADIR